MSSNISRDEFDRVWESACADGSPRCPECGKGVLVEHSGDESMRFMRFDCGHIFSTPAKPDPPDAEDDPSV
jgi:ribosomal protein S27AE